MHLDRAQLMQALSYIIIVLFLSGGLVSARYRRQMRWAAIGLYAAAVALALVWVGMWLAGR